MPSAFQTLMQSSNAPAPKRRRTQAAAAKQKITNKNIICLLKMEDTTKPIPIPREDSRARLTEVGLTGKIAINSQWQEMDVRHEISKLFASSFGLADGDILPYVYLRYV